VNKFLLQSLLDISVAKRIQFRVFSSDYEDAIKLQSMGLVTVEKTKRVDTFCVFLSGRGEALVDWAVEKINIAISEKAAPTEAQAESV